jgi:hypothetical protein
LLPARRRAGLHGARRVHGPRRAAARVCTRDRLAALAWARWRDHQCGVHALSDSIGTGSIGSSHRAASPTAADPAGPTTVDGTWLRSS